ncbi:MAG: hypothetical protein QOK25_3069 [Thermoleophilaceae bacterium]|nr:hypothetical protein [Thermoleophilaceae bacterium]
MKKIPFRVTLLAIALAAFGLRLLYAETQDTTRVLTDAYWYHLTANSLADGHGFTFALVGPRLPTAFHPPLFAIVLAGASKLGLSSYGAHRAVGCALGAATVSLIGLIGRRAGGPGLGLLSAGLAAVYLPLIGNDSVLMSESLYGLTIAGAILAALWLTDAPSWRRAAVLGAVVGLAALTRGEGLLLLILLVPLVVRRAGPRSLRRFLVVAGVAVLVIAPWCIRNSLEFDRPVGLSTGDGSVLASGNNDVVYHGPRLGGWDFKALALPSTGLDVHDEAAVGAYLRTRGLEYARRHAGRLPVVVGARVLRTWSLYPFHAIGQVREAAFIKGQREWLLWATLVSAWAAMALSLAGAVGLRRRAFNMVPLLAPLALVTVASALFYGDVRFRDAAEVSLVVLAAAGLQGLWRAARGSPAARPA